MTIKELREKLDNFPDNCVVMIPDGNGYTPATHISIGCNELDGCVFIDDYEE